MGSAFSAPEAASDLPKVPIVYSPGYNVRFLGLEKLHPFDSCKYEKIAANLCKTFGLHPSQLHEPTEPLTRAELEDVHTPEYLDSLESSVTVARLCELAPLALLPHAVLRSLVLKPNLLAVRGTMLAARLALEHGVAINLGGGMHHASAGHGGGWCIYSDVILAYRALLRERPGLKMLLIDLDVHQGNGHERDKLQLHPDTIYTIDAFNPRIYPGDDEAKAAIDVAIHVTTDLTEESYVHTVRLKLSEGIERFKPDIIAYNAGSDILKGDPLNGGVGISAATLAERDLAVVQAARSAGVPIFLMLSGGYARNNAAVVGASLVNLIRTLHLLPAGEHKGQEEEAEEEQPSKVEKVSKRARGKATQKEGGE